jgi:hypothetical protein
VQADRQTVAVSDWFWEGNVQRAVVGHLVDEGWMIESETDTASRPRHRHRRP